MKLPRDVDARQLIKALARLGYSETRQSGSHIRLACESPERHSVTIPNHSPLKAGTLNAILGEVATRHGMEKQQLIRTLFA
jgi:predicted RNA binding protein YcfA (HicA-like mRNA interferase family)